MPVPFGPDFLCIGMGKAGTGWLYDTFKIHPDFWMPPIKEMHYLDRRVPKIPGTKMWENKSERRLRRGRERRGQTPYTERDFDFFKRAHAAKEKPIDYQVYGNFFAPKGAQMSGDITPGYALMEEDLIESCMKAFPKLKIIFLVRDPVSRCWSHCSMRCREDETLREIYLNPVKLRSLLAPQNTRANVRPSVTAQMWKRYVPEDQFHWQFFDDLVADPDSVARSLLGFMGADLEKYTKPPADRKAGQEKLEMTPETHQVLVDVFADEIRACAKYFGGHAVKWAEKYGVAID